MTYKTLLALADAEADDRQTLAFATELAAVFASHVRVLPAAVDIAGDLVNFGAAMGAPYSPEAATAVMEGRAARGRGIEKSCREACRTRNIAFGPGAGLPRLTILPDTPTPWLALSRQVSLTDLVVLGQQYLDSHLHMAGVLDEVILRLRAPVFVARGAPDRLVGTVVVAWDGSREAGRAVRAALPLLQRAGRVVIVQNEAGASAQDCEPDPTALREYLALHGVFRTHLNVVPGGPEAPSLLRLAKEEEADLLVAGAYAHPKIVQAILGGVTRSLLEANDGPCLLLCH